MEGECGLAPKLREDAGEKVNVNHEENEDVGRGCGCPAGCRPEKDNRGKNVAHGHDKDSRKEKDQAMMGT